MPYNPLLRPVSGAGERGRGLHIGKCEPPQPVIPSWKQGSVIALWYFKVLLNALCLPHCLPVSCCVLPAPSRRRCLSCIQEAAIEGRPLTPCPPPGVVQDPSTSRVWGFATPSAHLYHLLQPMPVNHYRVTQCQLSNCQPTPPSIACPPCATSNTTIKKRVLTSENPHPHTAAPASTQVAAFRTGEVGFNWGLGSGYRWSPCTEYQASTTTCLTSCTTVVSSGS